MDDRTCNHKVKFFVDVKFLKENIKSQFFQKFQIQKYTFTTKYDDGEVDIITMAIEDF